ncbi:hypothetical protein NN561_007458 [Cricetulus griseus]
MQFSKPTRRARIPGSLSSGPRRQRAQTPPSRSALPVRPPVKNSNLTATRRAMRKWPRPRCCHHHSAGTSWRAGRGGSPRALLGNSSSAPRSLETRSLETRTSGTQSSYLV